MKTFFHPGCVRLLASSETGHLIHFRNFIGDSRIFDPPTSGNSEPGSSGHGPGSRTSRRRSWRRPGTDFFVRTGRGGRLREEPGVGRGRRSHRQQGCGESGSRSRPGRQKRVGLVATLQQRNSADLQKVTLFQRWASFSFIFVFF